MPYLKYIAILFLVFSLSSCIEIIDDLTMNNDGSGTFKYTINLSSSKVKINSILALDSLEGKKVPDIATIEKQIIAVKQSLMTKQGIKNVQVDYNFTDFIFKFQLDFSSISQLQSAIKEVIVEQSKTSNFPELQHNWLVWDGDYLSRSIPEMYFQKTKNLKQDEIDLLKQGTYTSISRFARLVEKCSNSSATISKSRQAVMLRANPYALIQNPKLLENTVYLLPK